MRLIKQKLSQLSAKQLFYLPKAVVILTSPLWGYLLIKIIIGYIQNTFELDAHTLGLCVIYYIMMLLLFSVTALVKQTVYFVFNEQLNVEKYVAYYRFGKDKNKKLKLAYLHANSLAYFYQGNVAGYIGEYESFQETLNQNKNIHFYDRVSWHYHAVLAYLHLGKKEESSISLEKMRQISAKGKKQEMIKERYLHMAEWVSQIFDKSAPMNPNFSSPNRLSFLETTYYKALSVWNKGDEQQAQDLFRQVAFESADIFYSKEAKKYLQELE